MTRVLIVEDSPSVRELLVYILGSDPGIEVVGCASNGEEAIKLAQERRPDVITMDLHMPHMDGFDATRRIMEICPTPIVVVSGSGGNETEVSFRAIEAGALVIVQRPFGPGNPAHAAAANALIRTVKSMAEVKVVRRWSNNKPVNGNGILPRNGSSPGHPCRLIVIGASTGGPAVLRDILAELPRNFPVPVLIVQHMSSGFVAGFAEWLSSAAGFPVSIAEHESPLVAGQAYLAPDGFQMGVSADLKVTLSKAKPEHGMCPSVSYLFRSIPRELRPNTAAALLTGMGKDGALELRQLKDHGALTIVQDRETSAVYGMPGEAIRQDAARMVLAPVEIGKALRALGDSSARELSFLTKGDEHE